MLLPVDGDTDYDYFVKTMDYYHLEIYKRLDFIYKLADSLDAVGLGDANEKQLLFRRFHPSVFWPTQNKDSDYLGYDDRVKYYKPLLFMEEQWQRDNYPPQTLSSIWETCNFIRAKAYELFIYNYQFNSDDYKSIRNFIVKYYNVPKYFNESKTWTTLVYPKKRERKNLIQLVLSINDSLFKKRI